MIWIQILLLRAEMRAAYGPGVQYHWSVTLCGRVYLTSIDWVPGQAVPAWLIAPAHPNKRIAAALSGELLQPGYAALKPLSRGRGVRGHGLSAGMTLAAMTSPLIPNPFSRGRRGLPLPDP